LSRSSRDAPVPLVDHRQQHVDPSARRSVSDLVDDEGAAAAVKTASKPF
jgi:hypothetical protein